MRTSKNAVFPSFHLHRCGSDKHYGEQEEMKK